MNAPQTLARPLAKRVADLAVETLPTAPAPEIPENVIRAALDALKRGETHYTDRPGILPLRSFVSEQLRTRFGIEVSVKDVTITCGSTEARFITVKVLAKAGTQVVCLGDPARIAGPVHLAGVQLVRSFSDPAVVSVLYLTPDDDQATVNDLLAQVVERGWWVIWDLSNAKRDSAFHPGQTAALLPRTTTIDGLSVKMPGWRVGWMAGSEVAERLRAFKQSMTICTTSVSQWAAVEMAKDV